MSVDCLDVIDGNSAADLAQKRQERNDIISDLETIRQQQLEIDREIRELQKAVDANSESTILAPAIHAFNGGFFNDCFHKLKSVDYINNEIDPFEKSKFLGAKMQQLKIDMIHKYLFKPTSRDVLKEFILAVDIAGYNLLESVRKCFDALMFSEAEAQVVTFIYQCISQNYFARNHEEAHQVFGNEDVCEFAAGAIVFINTSINNFNVKEKDRMTEEEFAKFGQCADVKAMSPSGISREYMIKLYRQIKENPLKFNSKLQVNSKDKVLMKGYLYKQGGNYKSWTKRYFVLQSDVLYYYENADAIKPKGIIILDNVDVEARFDHKRWFCFDLFDLDGRPIKSSKANPDGTQVAGNHTRYTLGADGDEQRSEWLSSIRSTLKVDMVHAFNTWRNERQISLDNNKPSTPDPRRRKYSSDSVFKPIL